MARERCEKTGNAFRHTRDILCWSREQLAEFADVSDHTVKNAENGWRVRPETHRKLVKALNVGLQNESKPLIEIPYPERNGAALALTTHDSRPALPVESPLDNPHLLAILEALRHTTPPCTMTKLRLGDIRSPAELKPLWAIDNSAYPEANITFPHFLSLWQAYRLGLRVLFCENEIMGAIGIWPVSCQWVEKLKSAELKEAQLDSGMVRQCGRRSTGCWYISGIVERQQLIGSRGIKMLLEEGLRSWLMQAKIRFPCEIVALAFSTPGKSLLRRFGFIPIQDAEAMPDKIALYGIQFPTRTALLRALRSRKLSL